MKDKELQSLLKKDSRGIAHSDDEEGT